MRTITCDSCETAYDNSNGMADTFFATVDLPGSWYEGESTERGVMDICSPTCLAAAIRGTLELSAQEVPVNQAYRVEEVPYDDEEELRQVALAKADQEMLFADDEEEKPNVRKIRKSDLDWKQPLIPESLVDTIDGIPTK